MSTVKINNVDYVITDDASTDINTSFVAGFTDPQLTVSGRGYRADDPEKVEVEIIWNVDNPNAEDGADLVNDWDTADAFSEI